MKQLKRALAENQDQLEMRQREADTAREDKQTQANQALIEESKPKAKKARQAYEAKQAKAIKAAAGKRAKATAKVDKEEKRKQARVAKAEAVVAAKRNKEKREMHYIKAGGSTGDENSSDEEDPGEEDATDAKVMLHWTDWVIIGHGMRKKDGKPWFRVAMYGYPPEEGEKQEWAERKDLVTDGARTLIDKYIQERANFPPYSDLLVAKKKAKKLSPPPAQVDRSSPCKHDNYHVSFKMEDNPGFCKPGQYLHTLRCGGVGCGRMFAANLKEVGQLGQDKAARPTPDKPVYCCVNISGRSGAYRKNECRHALCNQCWSKAMLGDGAQAGGKRRRNGGRVGVKGL